MGKIAPESRQVKKARSKLQEKFTKANERINTQALQEMRHIIRHWLNRHNEERVKLSDREIKLFDENIHSAKTESRYVKDLLSTLKEKAEDQQRLFNLKGRVSR